MSQVQVFTDLVFRGDAAVSEARRVEGEFRAIAQRISAIPITVDVQFDPGAAGAAITQLRNEAVQTPLRLPVEADDRLTPALAAIREQQQLMPILIPIGLDPAAVAAVTQQIQSLIAMGASAGAMPAAGTLTAVAGAAALNASAAATPALAATAAAAQLPPAATPSAIGPAAATIAATAATAAVASQAVRAAPTFGPGTQFTPVVPQPLAPVVPAAAPPAQTIVAGVQMPAAMPQQMPAVMPQMPAAPVGADTPYASAAYTGIQQEPAAAGGGFGNYRAMRMLFRTLLVGKAGYETGAAGIDAAIAIHGAATAETPQDLLANQATIKEGQKHIGEIPILGGIIKELGAGISNLGSTYRNNILVSTGNTKGGRQLYEGDEAYATRTNAATEAEEKHTRQLEQQVELRQRIAQQLDQAVQKIHDQAALEGATGQRRVDLTRQGRESELETELKDPRFRDARGQLTGDARRYQAAQQERINAQFTRESEDQAVRGTLFNNTVRSAQLRDTGQNRLADAQDFESRLTTMREQARKSGQLGRFDRELEPTLRRDFNRQQGIEIQQQRQGSEANVRAYREAGQEATLRAADRGREADEQARNFAIDEHVRKLREVADAETDVTKKAQLGAEAEAAANAAVSEKLANTAEERRRTEQATSAFVIEQRRAEVDAARNDFGAELRLFDEMWQRRIDRTQAGGEKEAAVAARQSARRVLVERHTREVADIGESARELELRNQGRDRAAERARIQYDTEREVKEAGNDAERVAALRRREAAQLKAVDRQDVAVFGSVTDYARAVMEENARREPETPDTTGMQPGETTDAYWKRGRQPFRQNPLTAGWQARAERGERIRHEREQAGIADRAVRDTTNLGVAVMPGGPLDFSGRFGAGAQGQAAADEGGPFDKQSAKDFKDGSSDFKDAAADFKRTVQDPRNQLAVVKY